MSDTDGGINPYYIGDCKFCAAKIALIDDCKAQEKIAQDVAWDLEKRIARLEVVAETAESILCSGDLDESTWYPVLSDILLSAGDLQEQGE
jgi:hypothetical protein